MIQYEVSVHINQPVEKVFAYLADARNLRNWQADLIENESLTEGPIRVGSRFREVRQTGPRKSNIQAEITAFEPNKRFATKTVVGPQVTVQYAFNAEQGGTKITYQFSLQTSGFMRLMEPLMAGSIKQGAEADFQKLKQILES
ncbi:MAG TPA: SRPBCC family protein [Anaerolineales bacterium]|nr:SRPBCC family protein [Anaerolineales bacterium]HND48149.1 SRPBCC family protein [Anaerolineales bacterium]